MNTTENNKLIAEFMQIGKIVKTNGVHFKDNNTQEIYKIKYHSDWNWLIPVVEKIEHKLKLGNGDYFQTSIGKHQTSITRKDKLGNPYFKEQIIGEGKTKIESVYSACVEFIKWYNEQQK